MPVTMTPPVSWSRTRTVALAAIVSLTLVVSACSSSGSPSSGSSAAAPGSVAAGSSAGGSGSAPADTSPIVLGGLFGLTPIPFGNDAQKTAAEVFKEVNANGGINGRKINYVTGDDNSQTTNAGALARKFLGQGAVAFVGSASLVDCGVNRTTYKDDNLVSITGVGVDPFCYSSPNIYSIAASPYTQVTTMLYYAQHYLHDTKICYFQPLTPGSAAAIKQAVKNYEAITSTKLLIDDETIPTNQTSFATEITRAKTAGCDAVLLVATDTAYAGAMKVASEQQMNDVDFLGLSIAYTQQLASTAKSLGLKIYASSGLVPYTSDNAATQAWRKVVTAAHAQQTLFSLAAYVAAKWMVSVLQSIKGPITRQTVTAAFQAGTPFQSPLMSTPLVFGKASSHDRTTGYNVVKLVDGQWQLAQSAISLPAH